MRVVKFVPDSKKAEIIEIANTLKALQSEVDGYIEAVPFIDNSCLIVNEEGLIRNLPIQTVFGCQYAGNVLIVGVDGEKFTDVPYKIDLMARAGVFKK